VLTGGLAPVGSGQENPPQPPGCDPDSPASLRLVAPKTLPVGYPGGFHFVATRGELPAGPYNLGSDPMTIEPASDKPFSGSYHGSVHERQEVIYNRFPLRFKEGDGPVRISLPIEESPQGDGFTCRRVLSAVVTPVKYADPHLRFKTRRQRRYDARRDMQRITITVSGTIRRDAKHPVRVLVYDDDFVVGRKRIKPRGGRFAQTFTFFRRHYGGEQMRGRVLYPGDVKEYWPCDDVFASSGPIDQCTMLLPDPRLVFRVDCSPPRPRYCHSRNS
jgi:hypothetical protein